jgi:spermidine synthase
MKTEMECPDNVNSQSNKAAMETEGKSPSAKPTTPNQPPPIPARLVWKVLLIFIAFCSGAAIMTIELVGNRILAPWFGNSLYTWTALIGVILVAMSCGYYLGGLLVDRKPNYVFLSHLIMLSALLTLITPLIQDYIGHSMRDVSIVWGPVFASLLLFALPGCVLGTISPFTIRLTSLLSEDKQVGLSAGCIGMSSTFGSVVGTFGTGFVLIPHMSVRIIFLIVGLILSFLAAAGYLLFMPQWTKKLRAVVCLVLGATLVATISFAKNNDRQGVLHEETTFYHHIKVVKKTLPNGLNAKILYLDTQLAGAQTVESKDIVFEYQRYWELPKLFLPEIRRAAFLGGGAYTMPEKLLDAYPESVVDVIEIDPRVVDVGRKFFHIDEYSRMNVISQDARYYLRRSNKKYDLIFGDVYSDKNYVPAHLLTVEFFALVEERLSSRGVFIMNLISVLVGEKSDLFRTVMKSLNHVFEHIYVFTTKQPNPFNWLAADNLIIVASGHKLSMEIDEHLTEKDKSELRELLKRKLKLKWLDLNNTLMLTDNYNPVEYIVATQLKN